MLKPKVGLDRSKTGRAKGTPNKTTALLKEAILKAAAAHGEDGTGKGELTGYCSYLAKEEPRAFAVLLGKVLPMQVTGEDGGPILTQHDHSIDFRELSNEEFHSLRSILVAHT